MCMLRGWTQQPGPDFKMWRIRTGWHPDFSGLLLFSTHVMVRGNFVGRKTGAERGRGKLLQGHHSLVLPLVPCVDTLQQHTTVAYHLARIFINSISWSGRADLSSETMCEWGCAQVFSHQKIASINCARSKTGWPEEQRRCFRIIRTNKIVSFLSLTEKADLYCDEPFSEKKRGVCGKNNFASARARKLVSRVLKHRSHLLSVCPESLSSPASSAYSNAQR